MQLTVEEKAFLEDKEMWKYGPCYGMTFCIEPDYPSIEISKTLIETENLMLWKGTVEEPPFFTVLRTAGAPPVGFRQYSYQPREHPTSVYRLITYPRQFRNFVGAEAWENVAKINLQRFQQLHAELFNLVRAVYKSHPIHCTYICDESYGRISGKDKGMGVYMLTRHIMWLNNQTDAGISKREGRSFEFFEL